MADGVDLREAELPDKIDFWEAGDPYFDWIEKEGVKRIVEYKFEDLNEVELGDWERKGGKGAVINIPSGFLPNDAHLVEIKPGGKSAPEHHMYEEVMYVVSGRGATSVWNEEGQKATFEWTAGSLVVIPLNATYQHFNTGPEPARYLALRAGDGQPSGWGESNVSIKEGGMQIEYEDEDPDIHRIFEERLAENGAPCRMKAFIPYCTGEVGPTSERDT